MRAGLGLSMGGGGQGSGGVPEGAVNLVAYGNSIPEGFNSTNHDTLSFPALLRDSLPPGSTFHNVAVAGETTSMQLDDVASVVHPLYDPLRINVLLYFEARNDLANAVNAARAGEHVRAVLRGAQNVGFRCASPTVITIPLLDPAITDAFNTWIRANYLEFSDGLVDIEADPFVGHGSDGDNLDYYSGDTPGPYQIHPNDAGHARIAEISQPVLDALIALGPRTPVPQFEFALPTLAGRWGSQIAKVAGVWRDESPRGIDLMAGASNPTASTLNGVACWLLDGVDDLFRGHANGGGGYEYRLSGTADPVTNAAMSIFMSVELVAAGSYPIFFCYPSATIELRGDASSGKASSVNVGQAVTDTGASIVGSKHTLLVTITGASGSAVQTLYLDGVQIGDPITAGAAGALSVNSLVIGSRGDGTLFANMKVGEIVTMTSVATSTERTNVGTYLATKWGSPAVP